MAREEKTEPMYPKVKITQVKSTINRPKDQKATIQALGLGKLHRTVEKEVTPQILGMLKKVSHLIKIDASEA
jgi:large subunit ribosomal protein L30